MTAFAVFLGKLISFVSNAFGLGAGATWPGEIALLLDPHILSKLAPEFRKGIILVAGTNGKTTTSLMVKQILEAQGLRVIHNGSGANLLNGVISACIQESNWLGRIKADYGVFEIDENSLPIVLTELRTSNYELRTIVVLLNLFRDQLDRYGEVDVIAEKWEKSLAQVSDGTTVVLNSDDPLIAHLGKKVKNTYYFGIEDKKYFLKDKEHATDSTFCLNCGARLTYSGIYFSHLGIWKCPKCGEKRPKPDISFWKSPLPGLYNLYNTLAAVSVAHTLKISDSVINHTLSQFHPAFGRQEEFSVDSKIIKLFLSKNPAGFNASLRTVLELKPHALLLVLNDRIPDGRDVSWIWDVDFETIPDDVQVIVSGDRVYDMGLRIKYSQKIRNSKFEIRNLTIEPELKSAIETGLKNIKTGETLYVLSTYSAMLEVRKLLTGKKIL